MNAQNFSGLLICLLSAACIFIVFNAYKKVLGRLSWPEDTSRKFFRNTTALVLLWVTVLGVLSVMGVFAGQALPPRPMITVLFALVLLLALSFTPRFKAVLQATPIHWLIAFQVFRIGVELWFWYSYQAGVFPKIITFEGANWDIIAGMLALPAAWAMRRWPKQQRVIAITFNITGLLLLLNTLRAAALSIPSPVQQYPFDERLLLLGTFPFIYLPGILVVLALGFHVLSLRQVYLQKSKKKNAEAIISQVHLHQSV